MSSCRCVGRSTSFDHSLFSPDLHHPQTTANLSALLAAPISSYQSVLTLLALQQYSALLVQQPYSTRRTLAHSLISSVLKNETVIETPEDVNGILDLCHVLIRDQPDAGTGPGAHNQQLGGKDPRRGPYHNEKEEMAEEQGWVARMVHLFRSDNLDVQFEVSHSTLAFMMTPTHLPKCRFFKQLDVILRLAAIECVTRTPR